MLFSHAKRSRLSRLDLPSRRRTRSARLNLERLEERVVLAASFTPAQIAQAYGFNQISFNSGAIRGDGTGQTIAIIDAFSDPNITQDLNSFDKLYGLTSSNSPTLYQNYGDATSFLSVIPYTPNGGTVGAANTDWALEESLDVEWAHAVAPGAKILLVEAQTANSTDLYPAAQYAATLPNVSVVSMSFGATFSGESGFDSNFSHNGVTFVASAGDNGLFGYPGASSNVVAVGGTALRVDASGNYVSESVWNDSTYGGSEPAWVTTAAGDVLPNPTTQFWGESGGGQNPYDPGKSGPDVAYDSDPYTGYYVFDSDDLDGSLQSYTVQNQPGLLQGIGGTSIATPQWAALIAIADQGRALAGQGPLSSSQTLTMIHNSNMENFDFRHNIPGSIEYTLNGSPFSFSGQSVYGQGTPIANVLVPDLVYGAAPGTPSGLTATTVSTSQINLGWNSVTDAHSYTLEWSTDGSNWGVLATTGGTTYSDTGLQAGTTYYYRILASNGLGSSAYSALVHATTTAAAPATPTGLHAATVSTSQINLSWNSVANTAFYTLERSPDDTNWQVLVSAGGTTYSDTGLQANTTYYYRVSASNAQGPASPYSAAVGGTTLPTAPTDLTATRTVEQSNQSELEQPPGRGLPTVSEPGWHELGAGCCHRRRDKLHR